MSGDEELINAYIHKRDLYATVASGVYHNGYWDNMEQYEDGTSNPDGKKRRSAVKKLVLAILYGMGADSLAVDLNIKKEEAQKLIDDFYKGYPTVKKFIDNNILFAHNYGYVESIMGRRRRLPDAQLPKYTIKYKNGISPMFNPILGTELISGQRDDVEISNIRKKLENAHNWRESKAISDEASKKGITVINNGGFISRAERQSTNSIIQGGAAIITKLAMIDIANDRELNELGFRMLICVHDEVIGECPSENKDRVGNRLQEVMIGAASEVCNVPMKVDTYKLKRWYIDDFTHYIANEVSKMVVENGVSMEEALKHFIDAYPFISKDCVCKMANGTYDIENSEEI